MRKLYSIKSEEKRKAGRFLEHNGRGIKRDVAEKLNLFKKHLESREKSRSRRKDESSQPSCEVGRMEKGGGGGELKRQAR